ncbi:SDR family NAD(P)-dependent oxidoreductase [Sphingomonas sp. PL20]|uniref:SDR family NAD(P)-dependent oxidoreductase n=1 Tax=Sphingomonas sp. PL20 TaxID=2760712 RepID=UPI001AE3E25C
MSIVNKGTALITGASSGIGAVYADRLASRGYNLILVARNSGRLHKLATRLTDETGQSIEILSADLTEQSDLARIEKVVRADASITLLLNSAGVGVAPTLLAADSDKIQAMIALNIVAVTRLVCAAVPGFVARGTGTIINIASILALAPELLNGAYGASKAFVLTFSRSLHHEFAGKGMRIQAVLPGAVATEFWGITGTSVENLPEGTVMSADDLVDAALAGLDQGELITIPSLPNPSDWAAYEAARRALAPNLSRAFAAPRFGIA